MQEATNTLESAGRRAIGHLRLCERQRSLAPVDICRLSASVAIPELSPEKKGADAMRCDGMLLSRSFLAVWLPVG